MNDMNDVLKVAMEYWENVCIMAIGHYNSAEWHRKVGMWIGGAATILSAIISTAIFARLTSQTIQDSQDGFSFSIGAWIIAVFSFVTAALTAANTFRNDTQQAEQHQATWAGYLSWQHQLDLFRLRHANSNPLMREEALKELASIAEGIKATSDNNKLTLTITAYQEAAEEFKIKYPDFSSRLAAISNQKP